MIDSRSTGLLTFLGVGLAAAIASPAHGQVLFAAGRGFIDSNNTSSGNAANLNYSTGFDGLFNYRSHFDFAIPTLTGTLTSAIFELDEPGGNVGPGHAGPPTTVTFSSLGTFGSYNFSGIGTGTVFGTIGLSSADNGTTVLVNFNAAGLAAITAKQGSIFSIGGVSSGENSPTGGANIDFELTDPRSGPFNTTLVLSTLTGPAPKGTPEPGAIALALSAGVCGAAGFLRRRRKIAMKNA